MNLFPSQQILQIDVSIFPLMEEGCAGISCSKRDFKSLCLLLKEIDFFTFESDLTSLIVKINLIQLANIS